MCDSSVVVAALTDDGADGGWATTQLRTSTPAAPHHLPFEVDNVLRRRELAGLLSPELAAQAHQDLLDLPVQLWPHRAIAARAWALRANVTSYDAAYVALAEHLDAALVTLDRRLAAAPGLRCEVRTPPR